MQDIDSTSASARTIAQRFAPPVNRREMLTGSAVAALVFGAATITPTGETKAAMPAAALMAQWREAAQAHLEAEREHGAARSAVEFEQEHLPGSGPMPEAPDPADYVSEATLEAGDVRAIDAEAERNPAYRAARANHMQAVEDWHAAAARERAKERQFAETHGLAEAERADRDARHRMMEAGRAILAAPLRSKEDVLAAVTVILYTADINYGIFDDEEKCLGVDPEDLLRRLGQWLPAPPAARLAE